jgi:hypothetical protein
MWTPPKIRWMWAAMFLIGAWFGQAFNAGNWNAAIAWFVVYITVLVAAYFVEEQR